MNSISNFIYKIKVNLLTIFGNIRFSKYPPFLFYDDVEFDVTGDKIEKIEKVVEPGDVLLRGYDSYVDSLFIKSNKKYSHAGVYIGKNNVIHAVAPNVSKEHLFDFCHCDRIAVLRPRKGVRKAIAMAKKFLRDNVKYDFNFTHGKEALYCFELAAYCYQGLKIEKVTASALRGLIKKREKVFLSDSFLNSEDFTLVYECNPKFNIKG